MKKMLYITGVVSCFLALILTLVSSDTSQNLNPLAAIAMAMVAYVFFKASELS